MEEVPGAPRIDRLRHYFNHPGFIEPMVDATLAALADLPEDARRGGHLAFVTHSIPVSMNDSSGPRGGAYIAQHRVVMAEIIERVREETGHRYPPSWSSARARETQVPWLEPDINDHLRCAAEPRRPGCDGGADRVRLGPHGGHLRPRHRGPATAEEIGLPFARAATAGIDPRFVAMVRDLLLERGCCRAWRVTRARRGGIGPALGRVRCGLLPEPPRPKPALCGQD